MKKTTPTHKFKLITEIYADDAKVKNGQIYVRVNIGSRCKYINYSECKDYTTELK